MASINNSQVKVIESVNLITLDLCNTYINKARN